MFLINIWDPLIKIKVKLDSGFQYFFFFPQMYYFCHQRGSY